jgi:signal transduction histidine kinase
MARFFVRVGAEPDRGKVVCVGKVNLGSEAAAALRRERETELRNTLRSLCDVALAAGSATPDQFALGPAVHRLAAVMPLPVIVDVETMPLDPTVASAVYATICEALGNVVGHAGARQAIVTVRRHGPTVQVMVADDGIGGAAPVLGGGIVTLAARAAVLGGLLHVDSPPDSGTRLALELPRGA